MLNPMYWCCKVRDRVIDRLANWLKLAEQKASEAMIANLKTRLKSCGRGITLRTPLTFSGAEYAELGDNVHIGTGAFIRADGGLIIGDNTHVSRNLVLYTVNHRHDGERIPYDDEIVKKPVVIGRNVWIGMNVCIAPGTTIGDGAIIGMGTTVSGIVEPLSIVGSAKWRVLGYRDKTHYQQLEDNGHYGGPNGFPLTIGGIIDG